MVRASLLTPAVFCQTRQQSHQTSSTPLQLPGPPTFTHSPHLPLPPGRISGGSAAVIKKAQLFKQLEGTQRGWTEGDISMFSLQKSNPRAHQQTTRYSEQKPKCQTYDILILISTDVTVDIKTATLKLCSNRTLMEFSQCQQLLSLYVVPDTLSARLH